MVDCQPLSRVLRDQGVRKVAGAKLDIEGYEMRVLARFFEEVDRRLYPQFLVVEDWSLSNGGGAPEQSEYPGDLIALLRENGYRLEWSTPLNHVLSLS